MIAGSPAGAIETRLSPDADARVEQANPGQNFGSSSRLNADLDPATESYLRFTVPAGTGVITRATLRLRVENGTSDGPEVRATTNVWDESGITWDNRPAALGVLADAGKLADDSWASYDVTAGITGAGPVTFAVVADSTDGVQFSSRQSGSNRPELVVESLNADGTTDTAFVATVDAHAEQSNPSKNFGSSSTLKVQGGPDPGEISYLRFTVGALPPGVVRKA
ncbi:MAG TPA: DNRLRE domain-containing protein, partial [Acidimicrobiia bacterium]|nr:DNRLRE domain-containing protein [Acidimicrobiia bacterium]